MDMDNKVTLTYVSYDENGEEERKIEHTFTTYGYLPDMLRHYRDFLQGVSFNYVSQVYAVKDDGGEIGEEG